MSEFILTYFEAAVLCVSQKGKFYLTKTTIALEHADFLLNTINIYLTLNIKLIIGRITSNSYRNIYILTYAKI